MGAGDGGGEWFGRLVDRTPAALVVVGDDGLIQLVNRRFEELVGAGRGDLLGRPAEALLPSRVRPVDAASELGRLAGRGAAGGEVRLLGVRADGSELPVGLSVSRLEGAPGSSAYAAVVREVGDHGRAARFRGFVEAAPDAMVVVGDDGRIELVNEGTLRLFGYARQELVGQAVEVLVPERYRAEHPARRLAFGERPRTRPMGVGLQLTGLRKDGSELPVEISLSPVELGDEVVVCASIRDVTERREAEHAQALAFQREQEATARLREVDRLRSDFLSTVSHELRTPLTAITGFAEWLSDSWEVTPDARKKEIVERILAAADRLDLLIRDLLDFSRLERGRLRVVMRTVPLAPLVRRSVEHVATALDAHRVDLRCTEELCVHADEGALSRVVENLLTNAAKFSPPGSVIEVSAAAVDGEVELTVRDHGVGIPEPEQDRVFERFYRVAATADHPGTGIGLAIVKQFVEAIGGRVTVTSRAGQGSAFTLRLQAVPERS